MLLHQNFIPFRFFELVQAFAVQILDQLDLEHLAVIEGANDRRNRVETRFAAGAPAPLTRDDFESLALFATDLGPHDDRLDHLHRFDVLRQILERAGIVMRSPALLDRGPRGFDAFECEISDGERYGCGARWTADLGIHRKFPFELEVRRRLADPPQPPAAAQRSRPRGLARACEPGRSPREGLDGETGGIPCPFQGKPYPDGFPVRRTLTETNPAFGRFEQQPLTGRGCNRPGRLWRVDP